jgi:P22 coat protein - gene protein 5
MPNQFQNTQLTLWKTLARWKNNLKLARNVDRSYSGEFGHTQGSANKPGGTIYIPKPQRFQVNVGQSATFQGINNLTIPLSMTIQANVAYSLSSSERFLNADRMYEKFGKPAADALSNYVDYTMFLFAVGATPNFVGTPGTAPSDNGVFLDAGVALDNNNAPMNDDRMLIVSPKQMRKAITNDQALFHAGQELDKQYRKGTVGEAHGLQWFKSQNTPVLVTGTYSGTPVVNGANQTGSNLITNGWTPGSQLKGGGSGADRILAAGAYTANALSRASIGSLQPFVVTANCVADGGGNMVIPIYPAITPAPSQYQNVSASPSNGGAITVWGPSNTQYTAGLAFHEKAFAVVYGKLDVPDKGVVEAFSDTDPETGCTMRYMMYIDGDNDQWKVRWDILFGPGGLYPEWASVVASSAANG